MRLVRGLHNLRDGGCGCVLTIGSFDGVHRGHQALVARTRALAAELGLPTAVLSFEPTPREFFSADNAPPRVSTLRAKLLDLEGIGVDSLIIQRFDGHFAALEASVFVRDILVGKLGIRGIVIGDDFRFGARRAGDLALLQAEGQRHGFAVAHLPSVTLDGLRFSSTALREALALPDLARAEALLGRPYRVVGRVRGGLRLGRQLGMRTANIALRRRQALRFGVYAVELRCLEEHGARWLPGVANLGVRPTLDLKHCLLETHVLEGSPDLYGKVVEVRPRHFLRPEERFDSLDALAEQMQRDRLDALAFFGSEPA